MKSVPRFQATFHYTLLTAHSCIHVIIVFLPLFPHDESYESDLVLFCTSYQFFLFYSHIQSGSVNYWKKTLQFQISRLENTNASLPPPPPPPPTHTHTRARARAHTHIRNCVLSTHEALKSQLIRTRNRVFNGCIGNHNLP